MFEIATFIQESNKIDKQFDLNGRLIPGSKPGELMFDNQLRVIELIPEFLAIRPTPVSLILMMHRELTRGVDAFEETGNSGHYRNCAVDIGGAAAPAPIIAQSLIEEVLIPQIEEIRDEQLTDEHALHFAWWTHHLFECAHPMIDGNGRLGRLLLNTILAMFDTEMVVVYDKNKQEYYQSIQDFRNTEFPSILARERDGKVYCYKT